MLYIWNADFKKKVHKKGLLFFFVYLKKNGPELQNNK